MNQLKIQASKVYVKGNYVCFIMLGTISNKQEEQSEDKVIAAYKKQNEKAVKPSINCTNRENYDTDIQTAAGVILWCFSSAWQEKKHCRIREPILRLKKRTSDTPGNKYNESSGWKIPEKYESYLRDQFPGRDHWVSFQTDMELFMGKNEIHNVYIGKNHYLWNTIQKKSLIRSRFPKICRLWRSLSGKQNRTRMSM